MNQNQNQNQTSEIKRIKYHFQYHFPIPLPGNQNKSKYTRIIPGNAPHWSLLTGARQSIGHCKPQYALQYGPFHLGKRHFACRLHGPTDRMRRCTANRCVMLRMAATGTSPLALRNVCSPLYIVGQDGHTLPRSTTKLLPQGSCSSLLTATS